MWPQNCTIPTAACVSLEISFRVDSHLLLSHKSLVNCSAVLSGSSGFNGNEGRKKPQVFSVVKIQSSIKSPERGAKERDDRIVKPHAPRSALFFSPITNLVPSLVELWNSSHPKWINSTNILQLFIVNQVLYHVPGMQVKDRAQSFRNSVWWN